MKNQKNKLLLVGILLLFASPYSAVAGPYGDSLSKCLVSSTTSEDKTALVKWIFIMLAKHPQVKSMVNISDEQLVLANKSTAALFQGLLSQSCTNEAKEAMRYEGSEAIGQSFNVLGQIASREIFSVPEVAGGMGAFVQYIDKNVMDKALGMH